MEHKTAFRVIGILVIALLLLGIGYFQVYASKSVIETLYEIFILIIGGLGTIAIQLIVWPERFLPKQSALPIRKEETSQVQESENFKNQVAQEIQNINNDFYVLSHQDQFSNLASGVAFSMNSINYLAWQGKADDEKARLLGARDYHLLQNFYDALDRRNDYLRTNEGDIEAIRKLNQSCIDQYNRINREIDWIIKPVVLSTLAEPISSKRRQGYDPKYIDLQVKLFKSKFETFPITNRIYKRAKDYMPNRRIVVNFKSMKCCPFPDKDLYLIRNNKISANTIHLWPWEDNVKWAKKKGYNFTERLYWKEELLPNKTGVS